MSQSTRETIAPTLTDDLIRSAVLGFMFGVVLFVLSDQTGMVARALQGLGLPEVAEHLGSKQLAMFGAVLGVMVDLLVKLFRQGHRLFRPLSGQGH